MTRPRNEAKIDLDLFNFLKESKVFSNSWDIRKTTNTYVQEVLKESSKGNTGNRGEPDLLYVNEKRKILILVENKDSTQMHESKSLNKPKDFAVDGIIHYLQFFQKSALKAKNQTLQNYFKSWNFIGIAFSGDINDEYNHLISTYIINNDDAIQNIETNEFLNEDDYVAFFENIDVETISKNISKSSIEINRLLRTLDSQQRPILLSSLMICLYDNGRGNNDFRLRYSSLSNINIIRSIPTTVYDILKDEGIETDKIAVLTNEIAFINTNHDLLNTDTIKSILKELQENVIPLFGKKTNYDIIGKFYEEFLRYAGISNVKKGIVLTPNHITSLFTDLVDLKLDDVILDTCCGTGAFIIAGMNRLIDIIETSSVRNKHDRIASLKQRQLVGFEKSTTMYSLAISNMLFRGDGKSKIYNVDAFSSEAKAKLKSLSREGIQPTIGFINPPYGGSDNESNPTKKEIQFIESLLDSVSRFGVIIAPLSAYFKDDSIRKRILSKHTLKYVINMPGELFQPNASTHTAIAVFETNKPHNNRASVVFYNLSDDGFILSKNRGRTDALNKWNPIRKKTLQRLSNPTKYVDDINLVCTNVTGSDEWIYQAHAKTDYSNLSEKTFSRKLREYLVFSYRKKMNILDSDIDQITLSELLTKWLNPDPIIAKKIKIFDREWQEFAFDHVFEFERGKRLVSLEQSDGDIAYISSTKTRNGIDNYINPPNWMNIHENKISLNNSGSVGYAFYHAYKFVCSDHCTTIWIKSGYDLSANVALFILPLLECMKPKFNFAREISDSRLRKEKIRLPISAPGTPDWKIMGEYIQSLEYSKSLESL